MKKNILIVLLALTSVTSFAQEFKVKKGEVLLDGKPIAKMSTKVLRQYEISNLDGTNSITAYMRVCENPAPGKAYIEIANAEKKANDLDFAKYSPFNIDRSIIQTLFAQGLITENGIQLEKVDAFVNGTPTGLGEKYGCKQQSAEKAVTDALALSIDDSGTIFSKKEKIGYIRIITNNGTTNGAVEKYEVTNLNHKIIGTWYGKFGMVQGYDKALNQEIYTYDGKVFKVEFNNSGNPIGYKMSQDVTAMNIVKRLTGNGYSLGQN
jgi:hypothetical protein